MERQTAISTNPQPDRFAAVRLAILDDDIQLADCEMRDTSQIRPDRGSIKTATPSNRICHSSNTFERRLESRRDSAAHIDNVRIVWW